MKNVWKKENKGESERSKDEEEWKGRVMNKLQQIRSDELIENLTNANRLNGRNCDKVGHGEMGKLKL